MPRRTHLAAIAATALAAASLMPAHAQVSYALSGSFMANTDGDDVDETYNWSFTFTSASFLTSLTEVTPLACTISGTFYECGATQTIDPTASTFGPPITAAFVSFQARNIDMSGGGGSFYFFQQGAFSTPGVYTTTGHPNPSGPLFDDQGPYSVGNAGFATLTVSSLAAVPEPATWSMMIVGFGALGGALRRRRLRGSACANV